MSTLVALAMFHPGHGTTDPSSWSHYLTEPVHVVVLASAVVLAATELALWRLAKKRVR